MSHASARWRRAASDEAAHGLLLVRGRNELRGLDLCSPPDLPDHYDPLGLLVLEEKLDAIHEARADYGIAADADTGRLAEPGSGGLGHRFIGQGAGTRDDADLATLMNVPRHDANLAFIRRDDTWAVGADQACLATLQNSLHLHHVEHRDAFRDADDEPETGVNGFQDGFGSKGRRHVDHARVRACFCNRLLNRVENRQIQMPGAALTRGNAPDHLGAVGYGLFRMEGSLGAGEALADDPGVAVNQDGHYFASFTALTIFSAASARLSADTIGRPESCKIFLPSSTLVPSSRTTRGTCRLTSRAAATTPSAITSQRMMPPKMLMRIPSTLGSERMILKAAVTRSLVAPPPTSRKLAGSPP